MYVFKFFVCNVFQVVAYDEHVCSVEIVEGFTKKFTLFSDLYATGVVGFHTIDNKYFIVEKDHPHAFLYQLCNPHDLFDLWEKIATCINVLANSALTTSMFCAIQMFSC